MKQYVNNIKTYLNNKFNGSGVTLLWEYCDWFRRLNIEFYSTLICSFYIFNEKYIFALCYSATSTNYILLFLPRSNSIIIWTVKLWRKHFRAWFLDLFSGVFKEAISHISCFISILIIKFNVSNGQSLYIAAPKALLCLDSLRFPDRWPECDCGCD